MNWLVVTSPYNWEQTQSHNAQGFKARHRRKVERMQPGDRFVFYIKGKKLLSGLATVSGSFYEDHGLIWRADKGDDDYPWRIPVTVDLAIPEENAVSVEFLVDALDMTKPFPKWQLAFQGQLHELTDHDFHLIEGTLNSLDRRVE